MIGAFATGLLGTMAIVITGFVACTEFGSYAFVHPVLRRLPEKQWLQVEQGLLGTFGKVMPIGMIISVILAIVLLVDAWGGPVLGVVMTGLATICFVVTVLCTVRVNVPINLATARIPMDRPPADWRAMRARWEVFQALRSWLMLGGFAAITVAVVSA